MKQVRAYKYRFYPTDRQKEILAQTFGCCRYVYNWALRLRTDAYVNEHCRVTYDDTVKALTWLKLKDDTYWLNEAPSVTTVQSLHHLENAFKNFFAGRANYPVFKKKSHLQSASYPAPGFRWKNGKDIILAKMRRPLAIVWSRPLSKCAKLLMATVTKDEADRYFISIEVEEDIAPLPAITKTIGVDLGLKSMVITSDGHTYDNPRFFAQDEKKLAKAQRRHVKKEKGSKNRNKARLKVARIHKRIADRRRDYQHKLSTKIIRENQVVCVESLTVKNMLKNHKLAKAISDVGWGEFIKRLEYKAAWYGRTLVKIDRWYPSSKRCFDCGHILDSLSLDIRHWTCPECGVSHDRDINAAKNIHAEGLAVLEACGEAVRPGVVKVTPGKPQRSRKPYP